MSRSGLLAGILPILAVAGCTMVGSGGVAAPAPGVVAEGAAAEGPEAAGPRHFAGVAELAGSRIPVVLELRGSGADIEASLRIPELALVAHGAGFLEGDRLLLQLSYGLECEGQARIEGRLDPDGYRLTGTLTATDCTGTEEGPVDLRVRPVGSAAGRTTPFRPAPRER